ncbi:SRPBCC family protein [Octadecabacter sp. G9-8]|uniref:SRPBCC family protein n=1 Tax=Octadecabacter dasysiphoniae TaxID=2909341 RepID=A0ABS9CZ98_9RHOB|nr:SRPBCC family protein [Octadecabacter dasysiphoniae]MCF2872387.1 SRPBCC family protein [Octadecabacter dasysiphoniae]
MTATVDLYHQYDASPDAVWDVATDFAAFADVMDGIVTFTGMPTEGRCETGQVFDVQVRLFGKLPPQDYHMEVEFCDDTARVFQSRERGAGIKRWDHRLTVQPHGNGAQLHDHIEIDAGVLTPLYRLWAKFVYSKRHKPRLALLGLSDAT